MRWWNIYLISGGAAFVLSLILTPLFRNVAVKVGMVDKPAQQAHKNHSGSTPLMGGFALCSAWCLTLVFGVLAPFVMPMQQVPAALLEHLTGITSVTPRLLFIVAGGILITLLGFIDDKYHLSAKVKFLGQIVVAILVVTFADIRVTLFIHSQLINWCASVFWIVLIVNAINFFDNMDGLATGISCIAFSFFTITAIVFNHYFIACLATVGVGTTLGFWFYNHSPASIFMGDSGSHFLGYLLAVTAAVSTYYQQGITHSFLAVFTPIFVLAIPLFDLMSVVLIRIKIGKPVYIGDNNHISHRFCKMGMSRKSSVICVHLLAVIIGLSALPLLWGDYRTTYVCFFQGIFLLILVSFIQYISGYRNSETIVSGLG